MMMGDDEQRCGRAEVLLSWDPGVPGVIQSWILFLLLLLFKCLKMKRWSVVPVEGIRLSALENKDLDLAVGEGSSSRSSRLYCLSTVQVLPYGVDTGVPGTARPQLYSPQAFRQSPTWACSRPAAWR